MSKVKFEDTSLARFIKKRGMHLSLALLMFAVGVGSYAVYKGRQNAPPEAIDTSPSTSSVTSEAPSKPEPIQSSPQSTVQSSPDTPVEKIETEVSDQTVASFFVLPVTSGEIVKECDMKNLQYSKTYEDWRLHTAVDFAGLPQSPVKSAGHGVVTDVFYDNSYGQTVVIDHGNGIVAYYAGLNKSPSVKKGDKVTAGYQIGVIDSVPSESVDAPHLHLYVKVDGVIKDPMQIMKFTGQ